MSEMSPARSGELIDIVDEYGNPTGVVADKATVHAEGLRHRDVHVWVTNGQEVLQQQRKEDKPIMPGEWDISVGGHVGAGESYLEAAMRETAEELGLDLPARRFVRIGRVATPLLFPGWKHRHNIVGDNFVVIECDLAVADLTLQAEEVMDARWVPIDQLEDDLVKPETAQRHAPQPQILYALGIAGMRGASATTV